MDYIEDRIKRLEKSLSVYGIEITASQLYIKELKERVKALEEKLPTPITIEPLKYGGTIGKAELEGLEIGDHTDQSTEEFVKILRCKNCKHKGQPRCPMTFSVSGYGGYDVRLIDPTCDDDYCSRGEKR